MGGPGPGPVAGAARWATTDTPGRRTSQPARDGFLMYLDRAQRRPRPAVHRRRAQHQPDRPVPPVGDEPLICPEDEGGAIDAASYVEPDGTRYLLWKNDGNCCGKDTWLHLQPLSTDGLKLAGPPVSPDHAGPAVGGQPRRGPDPGAARLVVRAVLLGQRLRRRELRHRLRHREQARGPVQEGGRTAADECSDRRHRSRRAGHRHGRGRQDAHRVPRLGPRSRLPGDVRHRPHLGRRHPVPALR